MKMTRRSTMTQSIPNPYLIHTKWFNFTTKMQHPTNEDNDEGDEDYESDETMELETYSEDDDGSEADEESDDGSAAWAVRLGGGC